MSSKPNMTKEQFCKIMDFLKSKDEKFDNLCSAMEDLCPGEYVNFFVNFEYEEQIIDLLDIIFGFTDEDYPDGSPIRWFVTDYDFGTSYDGQCTTSDGTVVDFYSASAVYDYCISISRR